MDDLEKKKWTHPKLANITTVGIIALIIGISFFAYNFSLGEYNNNYEIHLQTIQKSFYNGTKTVSIDNVIIDVEKVSRDIVLQVALYATSLSAQNPIMVTGISEPFDYLSDFEFSKLPDEIILFFPDSLKYPLENLGNLSYNVGYAELYLNNNTKRYEGSDVIIYQFESPGGFYVDYPNTLGGRSEKNPDGTITVSVRKLGDPQELILSPTRFPVEPISATVNLQMTNFIQGISLLVINIGLIQSRNQIIHGVTFCFIHIRDFVLPKYQKYIKKNSS